LVRCRAFGFISYSINTKIFIINIVK